MTPIRVYHVGTVLVQEHNFEVEHRAGKMNQNANELSRAVIRMLLLMNHIVISIVLFGHREMIES